jgi:adenine-specific DNA glycosylase
VARSNFVCVCGFSVTAFPLKAEKKKPREEGVAVCVVHRRVPTLDCVEILFVKRPSKGLLAGQWECPSVVLGPTNVAKSMKRAERHGKIDEILESLPGQSFGVSCLFCVSLSVNFGLLEFITETRESLG